MSNSRENQGDGSPATNNPNVTMTSMSEETLNKLSDSISQFAKSALTTITVPEFSGLPSEDVLSFLRKFKLATITFSNDLRCLALNKALTGAAKTWAKVNIKSQTKAGDWASIKKLMLERFGSPNQAIRHHEKLSKLKFNPVLGTLTSFIEEFVQCYKQVYHAAKDSDIITAVKLRLPDNVLKNLYLLDDGWAHYESVDDLLKLARRLEHNIMPYEDDQADKGDRVDITTLTKALAELRDTVLAQKSVQPNPDKLEAGKSNEISLAAINHHTKTRYDQNNNEQHPVSSYNNQIGYRGYQNDQFRRNYRNDRDLRRQQGHPYNRSAQQKPDTPKGSIDALEGDYWARHGKPPGPCHHCGGNHFNRHCPYKALN